jgi:hypothetical protein
MWQRLELPSIDAPIRGFTFPKNDALLVIASSGLVRVRLDPVSIEPLVDAQTLYATYDPLKDLLRWEGEEHFVYDADGGDITLCDHLNGDRIVMDSDGVLLIMDPHEREIRQRIDSIRLPDDSWMFAGFSQDSRWLVACDPAALQVFGYVP